MNKNLDFGADYFFGQDKAIKYIVECISKGLIPNAWLFHGPIGVGKATLAMNVAKIISNIGSEDLNHLEKINEINLRKPSTKMNLTNVILCTREWDDKKTKLQKYITIDNIRNVQKKFSLRSTENQYKVCIVDSTDCLNISASSSLLKILEEPPQNSLFISQISKNECE